MATAEAADFDQATKDLGDKIAGLTLLQAKAVADYLEKVHGIKAASGGAVRSDAPRGVPRARRLEAAGRAQERRNRQLVAANQEEEKPRDHSGGFGRAARPERDGTCDMEPAGARPRVTFRRRPHTSSSSPSTRA